MFLLSFFDMVMRDIDIRKNPEDNLVESKNFKFFWQISLRLFILKLDYFENFQFIWGYKIFTEFFWYAYEKTNWKIHYTGINYKKMKSSKQSFWSPVHRW